VVKSFYSRPEAVQQAARFISETPHVSAVREGEPLPPALVAVYDTLTAPPRVEEVSEESPQKLIEQLTTLTYSLSHEQGGTTPYTVIREIVENFIHAGFYEVVVSILDSGRVIRFADQGPGIRDKDRAFLPGFSTATADMKTIIKGVGSGLPVARECLTFSGGTIEVDDNLGCGTVVTLCTKTGSPAEPALATTVPAEPEKPLPPLSLRQKQVLSLVMELESVGPTMIARELCVGLSTAYRDLEHLATLGLIESDPTGKRSLTDEGIRCLNMILGR